MLNNDEVIYVNRDNRINLVLYENDTAVDLSAVTEMRLSFHNTTVILVSTASSSGAIKWAQSTYQTGEVLIEASSSTQVSALAGKKYRCSLIVFDPDNSSGIVWDNNIPVRVIADPLAT